MQLKLILAKGEPKGKVIEIAAASTTIGRAPECDVVIGSTKVSRNHCHVEVAGDTATLVDDQSGNGTFVNGEKITSKALAAGDKVVIGPLGFVVEIDGSSSDGDLAPSAATSAELNDFLASLEGGSDDAPSGAGDDDALQLTDDDLS